MADTDVGKQVEYNADGEWVPAWVVEYQAGKDAGDHRVAGFTTSAQKAAGGGDVFNVWSTPGTKPGNFRL